MIYAGKVRCADCGIFLGHGLHDGDICDTCFDERHESQTSDDLNWFCEECGLPEFRCECDGADSS